MIKRLRLIPLSGLGNRMRAIASCFYIAQANHIPVDVYWYREKGLYASFRSLFEPINLPGLEMHDCEKMSAFHYHVPLKRNLYLPRLLRQKKEYFYLKNDFGSLSSCMEQLKDTDYEELIFATGGQQAEMFSLKQLFVPVKEIQAQIEEMKKLFSADTIGCHIRRSDNDLSRKHSPDSAFFERIDAILAENPLSTFFLCTDDAQTKADFCQKYGSHILTYHSSLHRNSLQGMRDAVTELFLLAETKHILGSYWSSYSELAAALGEKSLDVINI